MDETLEMDVIGDEVLHKEDRKFPLGNGQYVGDIGTVINSMIVHAQIHGGLAQGIGQALRESEAYDVDSGQILARSSLDYGIQRADDLIDFAGEPDESQPCTHNPLSAKGCGESSSIGAPAALVSAVLDALDPLSVDDIGRPLTPICVWSAIPEAKSG
ncbi:MAG: hypothetical protein EVA87_14765 [Rhodospirillaceae bacterium]|nr:MAG: hypothetical protein EVA87_14765 [Rhodospirillaceae bacterium]